MKILFSILAMVMLNIECGQIKETETSSLAVKSENISKVMQEAIVFSYEATSRGFYQKAWITKDSITVSNERNNIEKMNFPTPESDWNELMDLLKEVDVKSLSKLVAPTSKRQFDGAAFATFTISENKLESKTDSFDHGHPPIAIETLVNKVLSMSDMIKKQ